MLILPKRTTAPPTPAADKITLYCDTNEVPAYINDAGAVKLWPPWTTATAWTPSVTFGGASTGLTYGTRAGFYEVIGSRIFIEAAIILTAKGSSTGVALVTGLPFAANATAGYNHSFSVWADALASISGHLQTLIIPSSTSIRLEHLGTGTSAQLTEANFTNTSAIILSGVYQA